MDANQGQATISDTERRLRTLEHSLWRIICGPVIKATKESQKALTKELQEGMGAISFLRIQEKRIYN